LVLRELDEDPVSGDAGIGVGGGARARGREGGRTGLIVGLAPGDDRREERSLRPGYFSAAG
jgi:hypothetical protein